MKNIICALFLTIFFISCKNQEDEQTQQSSLTDSIMISDTDLIEDFNNFFLLFKKDSIFQINRIKFPLEAEYLDNEKEDGCIKRELIKLKDWKYESFYWDSSFAKKQIDAFNQRIEETEDSTKVFWEGIDNGIHVEFVFKLQDKKWYLCKTSDFSN